ncbi:hypothetical protein ABZW10_38320 [Kitasatospora sp. NPDC004723]|uniref:hypothetical protein n=1 Tax=Kitasatospora sp. NPDC004723 TaxID=3154288 RepID=UPI0033BB76C8
MSDQRPVHNEFNGTVEGRLVQASTISIGHAPQEPSDLPGDRDDEALKTDRHQSLRNTANGHFAGDVIQAAHIDIADFSDIAGQARPAAAGRPAPVAEEPQRTERESGIRRYLRRPRRDRG